MALPGFEQDQQAASELFRSLIALAREQGEAKLAERLELAHTNLLAEILTVVVCGDFKQGKSNLLNALLEAPGLFPVDADVATSLVTTVGFGETEQVRVFIGDEAHVAAHQISRDAIRDYVTEGGNPGNVRQARLVTIETPNPRLRSGLLLVDTPGMDNLYTEHELLTRTFLPRADLLLYVSDARAPLSARQLDTIRWLASLCSRIIFVVTKIDQARHYARIADENRQKLAAKLGWAPEQITIVPVSSQLRLDYLETKDEDDLRESNFAALEEQLWRMVDEDRGATILLGVTDKLRQALGELRVPIEAAWKVANEPDPGAIVAYQRRLSVESERLLELRENERHWSGDLSILLDDARLRLANTLDLQLFRSKRNSRSYLRDEGLLKEPQTIMRRLEAEIVDSMDSLEKQLNSEIAHIQGLLAEKTGITSRRLDTLGIDWVRPDTTVSGLKTDDLAIQARGQGAREFWANTLGWLSTAVSAGISIPVVGGIFGMTSRVLGRMESGSRQNLARAQADHRKKRSLAVQEIRAAVSDYLEEATLHCRGGLNGAISAMRTAVTEGFRTIIYEERKAIESARKAVDQQRQLPQPEAGRRFQELRSLLQRLADLQRRVETLRTAVKSRHQAAMAMAAPEPTLPPDLGAFGDGSFADEHFGDDGVWPDDTTH